MEKIFLLSPASTIGKRAQILLRPEADFELAKKLRNHQASLGEVFSFLSGLYFRGKFAYANHFGRGSHQPLVITAGQGLMPVNQLLSIGRMMSFSDVDISPTNQAYLMPLESHLHDLKMSFSGHEQVVLLGSVATGKYVEPLLKFFNEQLFFPKAFKGLGDMSRGALMLRAVASNQELEYESLFPFGFHKRTKITDLNH